MPLALDFDPIDAVYERFALLSQLPDDQLAAHKPLCEDAWNTVLNSRRNDAPLSDGDAHLLCNAAAASAFYQFALLRAAIPDPDFSAGDVRVSCPAPDLEAAKTICQDARARVAHLLADQNFLFRAFRGDSIDPQ